MVFGHFFFIHLRSFYHAEAEQGEKDSLFNKGVGDSHKKFKLLPTHQLQRDSRSNCNPKPVEVLENEMTEEHV